MSSILNKFYVSFRRFDRLSINLTDQTTPIQNLLIHFHFENIDYIYIFYYLYTYLYTYYILYNIVTLYNILIY